MMDALFDNLVATGNVIIYMDDILIVTDSDNIEDHVKIVSIVVTIHPIFRLDLPLAL